MALPPAAMTREVETPPLSFTVDQLEALALGLSFVIAAGDQELAQSAAAARATLEAASRRMLSRPPIAASRRASGRAPEHAAMLRHALRTHSIVAFDYRSERSPAAKRRLWPTALTAFTNGWTVNGWCETRNEWRSFRLDRMRNLDVTNEVFDALPIPLGPLPTTK